MASFQNRLREEIAKSDGVIIEEYAKGYLLHDRVLIPAKVVTAKAPAGDKKDTDAPAEETEPDN